MGLFGKKKTVTTVDVKTTATTTTTTTTTAAMNRNDMGRRPAAPAASLNLHDAPRQEGEKRIYNLIILDESGSMGSIYNQALSGANETIDTIRIAQKENPELVQTLTFVTFDSGAGRPDVRAVIDCQKIDAVKELTKDDYKPNGCTPLYDAMGISIRDLSTIVKDGDNVLVTIITDGYENSSRIYNSSMVKEMVEGLRAKGWVFTYIGANQDSVEVAGGLGIRNSMDFCQDERGAQMMWDKLNSSRREYYKKASRMQSTGVMEDLESDFFSMKRGADRITPDHVENLGPNEVLVLGSSTDRGLDGNRYYIDTINGGLNWIAHQVNSFIAFADAHPETKFYVTRIGCGHAGYDEMTMAMLFARAYSLPNVALPASFWKVLDYKYRR